MADDEIMAVCRRLGLPRPMTLPNLGAATGPPPLAAEPSDTRVADIVRTLGRPDTVVFAHRQDRTAVAEIAVLAVSAPWAVEQRPERDSVFAFSLFAADEVVDRVASFCRLEERDEAAARDCQIAGSTWLQAMERAGTDPAGSVALLRADGLSTATAGTVAAAMAACQMMAQVTVVHRPTVTSLVGTTTSWFDAGPAGLWRVDAPKLARSGDRGDYGDLLLERVLVTIGPVTRDELIGEIRQGFAP
jgi:hypothetical protein